MKANQRFHKWLALPIFLTAIASSGQVKATTFTSTQSGSWGNAATWGGAGVPGCGDDVIITIGDTVTLDTARCSNNLTINGGGALDLAGQEMDFSGTGTTFTNNGTVNNTGGFNRILFNVTGNLTQTLGGAGTYSPNLKLQLFANVGGPGTFNVAPGTSLNFNSAGTNNINIDLGGGPVVNVTNALTVIAPSSGVNYVILSNNATMSGAGGLKTQGNVKIEGSNIAAPVEIVSGAALAEGTSSGNWTVDSAASLSLTNALNLFGNMTIPSGATVDLAGQEMDFSGTGTTFTNNGTVNNNGGFNRILFNVTGNLTQTLSGTGTYSGNLKLQLFANVGGPGTFNVAPGTSLNFNSPTNNINIDLGGGPTVNLTNALTVTAPSSGANYVILSNNATMSGAGGLKTQGNVKIEGSNIAAPVEIVSGAALAEGTSSGNWMVDSAASLSLTNTLNLFGNVTILSGATVDVAGQEMAFSGTGTTFTNNGTVNNTGGFHRILFNVTGNLTQTLSGTGTYSGNLNLEFFANVGGPGTINVASGTTLTFGSPAGNTNIQMDGGPTLNFIGSGGLTLSGNVSNSGTMIINGGGVACGDATKILIRSSVPGTQRAWSGGGTFSLTDVDVKDQAGSAAILATGGIDSGNNGSNWTFTTCGASTPTPSPTPPSTPTPTPTSTPIATPTPTPGPSPTPSGTPQATPSQLLNIATRMRVQTGENVLIGGFIVTGTDPKRVIIRGIGPSLSAFFSDALADPTLELYQGNTLLMMNDNWRMDQEAEIVATGIPPSNDLESAIVQTLTPGSYTAILRGKNNTTGIGVVEAYDLNRTANSRLANIATRGFVETGDNVMIGGLIIGPSDGTSATIVVRAIGPSLGNVGISGALQDPTLDLVDSNGVIIRSNDNWRQSQEAEIIATGLAPSDDRESALVQTVAPGSYTAIVRGAGTLTGVALVEVYHLQ